MKLHLIISLVFVPLFCFSQINDTTLQKLDTASHAEMRARILVNDGWKVLNGNPKLSIQYAELALSDSLNISDKGLLAKLYRLMAFCNGDMNNRKATLKWHLKRLDLLEGDTAMYVENASANFETAALLKAQGDLGLARKYFEKAHDLAVLGDYPLTQAQVLMEFSEYEKKEGNYDLVIKHLIQAKELFMPFKRVHFMIGQVYSKMALVYKDQDNSDLALENVQLAVKYIEYDHWPDLNGITLLNSSEIYNYLGKIDSALWAAKDAIRLFEKNQKLFNLPKAYGLVSEIYEKVNTDSALYYLKKFVVMNDSVINTENNNNIAALQIEYEDEKKQKEIKLLKQENELSLNREKLVEAESKRKDAILKTIIIALGVALILLLLLVYFFKQLRRKSNEVKHQKNLIEIRSKEIDDSIKYAKRIQMAMIPNKEIRQEVFSDSFVFYRPKDTLSGDFYWCKDITTASGHKFKLFVVGDCTGHGVPGALLSILGVNFLNLSAVNPDINSPSEALDFLNSGIKSAFKQSKHVIRDGMDIVMGAINMKDLVLNYASAKNPLYVVRDGEINILKGDKFPVGNESLESNEKFQNFKFDLEQGDMIYTASDGFQDQFGGPVGKKYKLKNFKELLVAQSKVDVHSQKENFEKEFDRWRNTYEQIDDVCIFGIRI